LPFLKTISHNHIVERGVMEMRIPQHNPHPLKAEIRKLGLTYWQLRTLLGGSPTEGTISRMLNGVWEMPKEIEEKLEQVVVGISRENEN
jgi:hypothetical protein